LDGLFVSFDFGGRYLAVGKSCVDRLIFLYLFFPGSIAAVAGPLRTSVRAVVDILSFGDGMVGIVGVGKEV